MKLVIFDLDGTILDTVKDLTSAVNHLLKQLNRPLIDANQVKAYLGQGPKYLLEHALNEPLEGELFDRYYKIYNDYYQAHQLDYTKPYEGIPKVLNTLKKSGYLLAVVSNKQAPVTQSLMENPADGRERGASADKRSITHPEQTADAQSVWLACFFQSYR